MTSMKKMWMMLMASLAICHYGISQAATALWKTLPVAPPMMAADDSGFAPVNDIKMYYAIFNKNGKDPVFLLHGGFSNSDTWSFEVPLLSKTHMVIIADSRGHGRSSMSGQPFSYNLMASDVLRLMDYLKIKRAAIVGWSDGGILGLILAIHHPDRISKLFTFGANFDISGYKTEAPDTSSSSLSRQFFTRAQADYRRLSPTPDSFGALQSAMGKLYGAEPHLDPEDIKAIKAPTVIAFGEYEQFIRRDHFEALAKLIPNARLVMLPNVSHGGPIQDPAGFHRALLSLLDSPQ
jgi:pimeloyl-ACP methyl ester carboxylesterase